MKKITIDKKSIIKFALLVLFGIVVIESRCHISAHLLCRLYIIQLFPTV